MPSENHHLDPAVESGSKDRKRVWILRLFSAFAFGFVLYLFWPLIGEMQNVIDLIKHAHWGWIGLALCIQFVSYIFLAMLNYLLLSPFSGRIEFWRLMAVLPAMAFIEVALPSAGLSGVVLRARLLAKNGYSFAASSFTLLMETIYIVAVMAVVSIAAVWYLLNSGGIRPGQVIFLVMIIILLVAVGILVYRMGGDKARSLPWIEKLGARWNRLMSVLKRSQISLEDLILRADQFYDEFSQLKAVSPIFLLGATMGRVSLDIATLGACFAAFHFALPPGVLLTAYGLVLVLSGLAALPGGLGLVDVSLAVIFSRLGAPGAVAVAAALCYRLIAFWLVRFVGFVSWQVLEVRP